MSKLIIPKVDSLSDILLLPSGKVKRETLIQFLKNNKGKPFLDSFQVNRKYRPNLKDNDLKKLLKKGILVRSREGSKSCRHTTLSLSKTFS